jgi:hypothetical protein
VDRRSLRPPANRHQAKDALWLDLAGYAALILVRSAAAPETVELVIDGELDAGIGGEPGKDAEILKDAVPPTDGTAKAVIRQLDQGGHHPAPDADPAQQRRHRLQLGAPLGDQDRGARQLRRIGQASDRGLQTLQCRQKRAVFSPLSVMGASLGGIQACCSSSSSCCSSRDHEAARQEAVKRSLVMGGVMRQGTGPDLNPVTFIAILRQYSKEDYGAVLLFLPAPRRVVDEEVWQWLDLLRANGAARRHWMIRADQAAPILIESHPHLFTPEPVGFDVYHLRQESLDRIFALL